MSRMLLDDMEWGLDLKWDSADVSVSREGTEIWYSERDVELMMEYFSRDVEAVEAVEADGSD